MKIKPINFTDYLDGFQYSYFEGGGICMTCRSENAYEVQAYKNIFDPTLPITREWKLDFVATTEGFYSFTENRYIYQYRDHLGNTRVSFAKNSAGAPEITDTNNYYSFGLNHTGGNGLNSSKFGSLYSYKYNGKELQETGMFDYGWRQYMPDLGRWNGIDQLAESYHMASPYAYVMNNPISFLDPDGRDVKPTRDGYEFSGSDLQNVMGYLQGGGSARKLVSSLSAWEKEESGGDFWGYFGSWNVWGATGGDVGGNLYASTWGDGAMGATPYDIQEIVFTKTKITNVHSISDLLKQGALDARKPGRAQMMGGPGDPFGFIEGIGIAISAQESQPLKLAMLPLFIVTKNGDDALKILAAEKGAFSVFDWKGYPTSLSKPTGPFKILEGAEYEAARKAANNANRALHKANPDFKGLQIHEIHPVKFGGDPTNPLNKALLTPEEHRLYNTFWFKLQNSIKK